MINVLTSLNNLKTKVNDLDVGELRTITVELKKLSDVLDNEFVEGTKSITLKEITLINTTQIKKS